MEEEDRNEAAPSTRLCGYALDVLDMISRLRFVRSTQFHSPFGGGLYSVSLYLVFEVEYR